MVVSTGERSDLLLSFTSLQPRLCPLRGLSGLISPPSPPASSRLLELTPAHRMLLSVSRQIRRLDATHNDLGSMGCIALFEGLMAVRARFSAQSDEFWGMREINLAANAIGDEGLVAAMFYCAKDMCMKELLLQRNQVTVSRQGREGRTIVPATLGTYRVNGMETIKLSTSR